MDQINGWPKHLLCLCAMTGSCREQFGHFVLMSEVSSAVVFCKLPLNYAHSSSVYLFIFLLFYFYSSAVSTDCISHFWYLGTLFCYCHPWSATPAISRSDPFVGNYCIFNPDLDNGHSHFCSWAISCFEAVHVTHTLYPLLPIQSNATTDIMSMQCHIFNFKS